MFPGRLVVAATLALATRVVAQCPDGSPPPCRGAGAAAAARRPNPPLDDRTWIILPFDNVARVADIDWLKDASVNLLYLDMSKWHDIRVIDDERVADFIREVPEARGGQTLTLQSGIAVARRAGAGKLVMGDLLKVGSRTQLIAKVFDVRTGQRMRTVRQEAVNADSIMPAFGQLARAVLNVAPPEGTSPGAVGTASIDAYQAYMAGVSALNRWMLDSAQTQFLRAIQLDSTFALAHYKLSLVYGWQSGGPAGAQHAQAALRLGTNLPPREHSLVASYAAFESQHYADACGIVARLIQVDSTDVEAWYNLGECSYHDIVVVPVVGDTTRLVFRSSWNTSLKAFRRTLDLDPTYHLAFQHIQDGLLSTTRAGCRLAEGETTCNPQASGIQAVLRRAGDSLVTVPVATFNDGGRALTIQAAEAIRQHARTQNLEEARRAAEAWLAAGPSELRPRLAFARILLRMGQVQRADSVAQLISGAHISRVEDASFTIDRVEMALKVGDVPRATQIAQELRAWTDTIAGGARISGILIWSIFGHPDEMAPTLNRLVQAPQWVKDYLVAQAQAFVGAPADSLFEKEQAFTRNAAGAGGPTGRPGAATITITTLLWSDPRERHGLWPTTDTASSDPRIAMMSVVATGDTARIRRALTHYDSIATSLAEEPDNGFALAGAYGHLSIADTAGALRHLRRFRDVNWARSPILTQFSNGFTFAGQMWPRTFLLLGDLAAGTGERDEAARAYRMFVAMWQNGDPSVQPQVQRAREALARLGG